MYTQRAPSSEQKLDALTEAARFDVCLSSCNGNASGGVGRLRDPENPNTRWIYPARVPGVGRVAMLKVLQSNACVHSCSYCQLSSRNNIVRRTGFCPDELARLFIQFYTSGLCHGLFLSSGVCGSPDAAMQGMLSTADILRNRYRFGEYIHIKIIPGCSHHMVEAAMSLANRVSINIEAATPTALQTIAPEKEFRRDLVGRMKWVSEMLKRANSLRAASQTTQFVVGAGGEDDREILKTVDWVYRDLFVFRAYFSAYQSQQNRADPTFMVREHRLYQCDFLLRGYGFRLPDLVFDANGYLPEMVDPKTAYALTHPEQYPVDINSADEAALLKVPGIGPVSARRIITMRRDGIKVRRLLDLRKLGVWTTRAAQYIEFSGKGCRSENRTEKQQWLFDELSPENWSTNVPPRGMETTYTGEPYSYPAQRGKRLNYVWKGDKQVLHCR